MSSLVLTIMSFAGAQPADPPVCVVPDLTVALELLADSPTMQRARMGLQAAVLDVDAAMSVLSGEVSLGAQGTSRKPGVPDAPAGHVSLPLELAVTWTGLAVGPAAEARELAHAVYAGAVVAYTEAWTDAVVAIVRGYLVAVRAREEVGLAERERDLALVRATAATELVSQRAVPPGEATTASLELQRAGLTLKERGFGLDSAVGSLGTWLGCVPAGMAPAPAADLEALLPEGGSAHVAPNEQLFTGSIAAAMTNVVVAENAVTRERREAGMSVNVSAGGRLDGPVGELSLSLGVDSRRLAPTLNAVFVPGGGAGTSSTVSVGVELAVPLGGGRPSALAAAEARLAGAALTLTMTRADSMASVDGMEITSELARHRLDLVRSVLDLRRIELEHDRERHRLGLASDTDLEASRLSLARAEVEEARAVDEVFIAALVSAIARGHVPRERLIWDGHAPFDRDLNAPRALDVPGALR